MSILNIKSGIICHQVNAMGKMGAGMALSIRKKWPIVYNDYINNYKNNRLQLGNVIFTKINDSLYVASCVGQRNYGRNGLYTNYMALKKCFQTVNEKARELSLQVHFPYKIGCSLAGGDWEIVKNLIEENIENPVIVKDEKWE